MLDAWLEIYCAGNYWIKIKTDFSLGCLIGCVKINNLWRLNIRNDFPFSEGFWVAFIDFYGNVENNANGAQEFLAF